MHKEPRYVRVSCHFEFQSQRRLFYFSSRRIDISPHQFGTDLVLSCQFIHYGIENWRHYHYLEWADWFWRNWIPWLREGRVHAIYYFKRSKHISTQKLKFWIDAIIFRSNCGYLWGWRWTNCWWRWGAIKSLHSWRFQRNWREIRRIANGRW